MANEAVIIELLGNEGDPMTYTCNNTFGIEKGTLLRVDDPRTISGANLSGACVAGIAAAEKEAADGSTTLAVYKNGIFDLYGTGTIKAGSMVRLSGANEIQAAVAGDAEAGKILGQALESTTASGETIAVRINL